MNCSLFLCRKEISDLVVIDEIAVYAGMTLALLFNKIISPTTPLQS